MGTKNENAAQFANERTDEQTDVETDEGSGWEGSAAVLNECKHEWVSNAAETDCYMLTASGGTF